MAFEMGDARPIRVRLRGALARTGGRFGSLPGAEPALGAATPAYDHAAGPHP
jgi:hypothetical protein